MSRSVAGWLCLTTGLLLVVVHVVTSMRPAARGGGHEEGVVDVAKELAGKAPHLAGALAFTVLGLVVLGYLDVSVAAGATGE